MLLDSTTYAVSEQLLLMCSLHRLGYVLAELAGVDAFGDCRCKRPRTSREPNDVQATHLYRVSAMARLAASVNPVLCSCDIVVAWAG